MILHAFRAGYVRALQSRLYVFTVSAYPLCLLTPQSHYYSDMILLPPHTHTISTQ